MPVLQLALFSPSKGIVNPSLCVYFNLWTVDLLVLSLLASLM